MTDGSEMVFDSEAPTLTAVSIASDNAVATWAKADDTVTVTIAASEAIAEPTCVFADVADTSVTYGGSGTDWTCAVDVASGDPAGAVSFTIDGTDLAGNAFSQVVDVTDGSSVVFDETAPTVDAASISSSNAGASLAKAGETITLTITASESIQAPTCVFKTASTTSNNDELTAKVEME